MKKLFIVLFLAVAVMAIGAGSTFAAVGVDTYATENTKANAAAYRIATEAYDADSTTFGVAHAHFDQDAKYMIITAGSLNPVSLSVAYSNANVSSSGGAGIGYTLAVWVDANTDGIVDAAEMTAITDNSAAAFACGAGGGVLNCDPGDLDGIHQDPTDTGTAQDIPAGSKLVIIDAVNADPTTGGLTTAEIGFNLTINSGLSAGDSIVATVTENGKTGFSGTPTTDTSTLATITNQYRACVPSGATKFDGVVDTSDDRLTFENSVATDITAGLLLIDDEEAGNIGCGSANAAEYLFNAVAGEGSINDVDVTLCGNNQGLAASAGDMTSDGGGTLGTYGATTAGCWVDDLEVSNAPDYTATTSGTDALIVRDWTISAVSVPLTTVGTDYAAINYLSSTSAGSWTLNGAQYTLPYVSNGAAFGVTLIINNGSSTAGDISIDVISSSTGETTSNIDGGSVAAGTTVIISATDLQTLVETALPNLAAAVQSAQYSIVVTVNAPSALVTMEGLQADPGGNKRVIPTLHDSSDELQF